jgi:hypothetical protein
VIEAYEFPRTGVVVDVGGGQGSLLASILKKHSGLSGILFDAGAALANAGQWLAKAGIEKRCTTVAGDFFTSIPGGGDVYVLKHIIHDWPDDRASEIVKNCARVLPSTGRVLIIERLVSEGGQPSVAKLLDLDMLVLVGGKERTEREMSQLVARAGLRLSRSIPAANGVSILEAIF